MPSVVRQRVWRAYAALAPLWRQLQRPLPMIQGSFYLLRRKCGKPNCRCATGQLHPTRVLTRSEQGRDRLYVVPQDQCARVQERHRQLKCFYDLTDFHSRSLAAITAQVVLVLLT